MFAREGAKVLITDRDEESAERTRQMIVDEGGVAEIFVGDAVSAADSEAMVKRVLELWGGLHILHNNVGIEGAGTILEVSEEQWDRVMEVNVKSMFLASKYAIPAIAATGGGSVINISSISAIRPRGLTPYTASKGAVLALTRAMAVDHAEAQVRVNCILPGPVYTPLVYAGGMTEELRERRRLASPLKLEGNAWDIANAAVFLASDESRWITGVVLPVDGGVSISSPAR
jgi:NAD(P)-dependent dehydrogenase (short-subunit alcohol dehydrogenase family)